MDLGAMDRVGMALVIIAYRQWRMARRDSGRKVRTFEDNAEQNAGGDQRQPVNRNDNDLEPILAVDAI